MAIEIGWMSNEQLREEFLRQQKRMEHVVDAVHFRNRAREPFDKAEGKVLELEDYGRLNDAETEYHLFLNLR